MFTLPEAAVLEPNDTPPGNVRRSLNERGQEAVTR